MHGHYRPSQRGLVSAALREVFNAQDQAEARQRVGEVIDKLTPIAPKVAQLLEDAEEDLIAFYAFPAAHSTKLRPRTRSSASIARSAGAPTSSGSPPTTPRRSASRARC